ncbi:DUF2158 domain-containing protein [Acidovorax sp. CCYZU-2555]|uniref:DUF2158 domain-containing protein n=1 Tax=Acidovorax sp. CCYZU-2555 TaxID=2835042 RepID=UPI001BCC68D2|nr:DUF2158 domain-containing protein [Acidovorax sp. CCYZU-2555]MBS7777685.1 DUF2158 domain-containing protein [Acidovorax sp. CCYZU-2555]
MAEFAKGEKVRLVSGGPVMAVTDLGDYGPLGPKDGVKCVWFAAIKGVETPQERVFDAAVLEKFEPPARRTLRSSIATF